MKLLSGRSLAAQPPKLSRRERERLLKLETRTHAGGV